ncbi:DUF1206 domain-containing protein [Brevibacterium aurantiacum]|uniref:DUF1206 domain-containing protein n=2 Tax=Brevibacterium aurantiacum TaxID=273384 RepID=A0A2A3X1D6_BREAU|nr:DUF1206 domain-containing protein [Brevibacterium aurantiacum]PCC17486.1 hypothetical protein CIK79_03775 [Brevibacterium aurantiacum]PCC55932.1 hypothetical protein CIK58_16365 [Brevibacterium aurantiacum]SMY05282.1 protein of unknown function (DUF1206) [Brevibacterium aurantiacum]
MSTSAAAAAGAATDSKTFEVIARAGFAMNGLLRVLIGATSIRVASGHSGRPSQASVMTDIANLPEGFIVLWAAFLAFAALGVWQALEVVFGHRYRTTRHRVVQKGGSIRLTVIYVALAVATAMFALGVSDSSRSRAKKSDLSLELMQTLQGRLILAAVVAVIFRFGVFFVVKGIRRGHRKNLYTIDGGFGRTAVVLGAIGYIAKGAIVCFAGVLVAYSALAFVPRKAEGIGAVFQTMRQQQFGPELLNAAGVGLIIYGLFLACRAKIGTMANDY